MKSALFVQESMWKRQDREAYHRELHGVLFLDSGCVLVCRLQPLVSQPLMLLQVLFR